GSGYGSKGDQLRVKVTPNDGTVDGATVTSAAVTIVNSAPVVDSASIDQRSEERRVGQAWTATKHDDDGDTVTLAYQWQMSTDGGTPWSDLAGLPTCALALSGSGNGSKGDQLRVKVTPNDGTVNGATVTSAAVTIVNSAPVVDSASIDQSSPKTNDLLTTTVTKHDDDGDTVTLAYQWQKSTDGGATWSDLVGRTSSSLDLSGSGNGSKGDQLRVKDRKNTRLNSSHYLTSYAVTIVNSAPVVDSASIVQSSPKTNLLPYTTLFRSDDDGDTVTLAYQWQKSTDGGATWSDLVGRTSSSLDLSGSGNGSKGDQLRV